ncbi:DUF2283 domain-containing protein [Massilia sp. P8910]|uniref:DUF2283 domain-containing protein n=1 Tax=Massilia antarctica TaxID=2765360 RepID=UPI001E54B4D3|nr:DUF2283 domain-containing protein [Massilia antarctica]MCE3603625.1 DUF2283 domain-containing protein [Massilia antarctica]
MNTRKMELIILEDEVDEDGEVDDSQVAYLMLPDHPGPNTVNCVFKTTRLLDLVQYDGAEIYLDFDKNGRLIGIEILAEC